jgi:hypothetical protein
MILQIKCKAKHVYLMNKITGYPVAVKGSGQQEV